jgi:asparagine synthase (glutamine-hydrolysing)
VSQLARKKVKSVFSGEGADELFGGYTWQHDFFAKTHPPSLVEKFKRMLKPPYTVDFYAEQMSMGLFDDQELRSMLHEDYHQFIPEDVNWFYRKNFNKNTSPLKSIQLLDIKCFMGELVLTKIDRASMANSLEVRVPFLDHHLFEYVFSIKEETYYKSEQTKSLLHCNIKEDLPDEILQRPKQGFVGPDNYYMDIDWYKKALKNAVLVSMGIIKQEYIDTLLKKDYDWRLWKIIVMEKWFKRWVSQ